jgi:hypothetical protein
MMKKRYYTTEHNNIKNIKIKIEKIKHNIKMSKQL